MSATLANPAREFWQRTWTAWKGGALRLSSSFYADNAKGSFEDFMRDYKNASDPGVNRFFAEHPPLPNEFFCAYQAKGASTELVVTNLRAWMLDQNEKRLLPFEFNDIAEFASKAMWNGRCVLVSYRDGTEAQHLVVASPTDEVAHIAIKSAAESYGLPRSPSVPAGGDVEPECLGCGAAGEHPARYVACVSKTKYAEGRGDPYVHIDDAKFWGLRLCAACIPKVRMQHLRHSLKSHLKHTGFGLFALAFGFGAAFLAGQSDTFSLPAGDGMLQGLIAQLGSRDFNLAPLAVFVLLGGFVILMGVATLAYAGLSIASAVQLALAAGVSAPKSAVVDTVYVAAAEQILRSRLEGRGRRRRPERRALPLRKLSDDLPEAERSKAQHHSHSQHTRSILPVVAATREELLAKLPEEVRLFA